jgi:Cu(I)/Ag(I) efflux system membrane protein CusA/SilA
MIRSRGYAQSLQDFADIPLGISEAGSQIRIGDVGRVAFGPDLRRGTADLNGRGQVVSGIVIMRDGANALDVITRVKRRLNEITSSLPAGVRLMPVYDRSELIQNTIGTARRTLIEIAITIGLIVIIFLRHFPSAVVPLITTPITVILTLVTCRFLGLSANVMSLAGVALAFSELADASIIVVEQIHKRLEAWDRNGRVGFCQDVVLAAIKEVCAPAFFALLVMAVSFLPVLLLPGEEGRMFRPLAYTKTLTLVIAAILAITFDPALRLILTRTKPLTFRPFWLCRWTNSVMGGAVQREDRHPVTRSLMRAYEPAICWCLNHKIQVIVAALLLISLTVPAFLRLGTESLPPFDEGAILYMPSTLPGISVAQAEQLLHLTNGIIAGFPEVDRVIGKAGRAETATDPAPLSMLETTIILKQRDLWPRVRTWYSDWAPAWIEPALRHITPDTISTDELISQMNAALRIPGLTNAWTMPIRGRIDMLSTGMRTPLGLKVSGPRLEQIQQIAIEIEGLLRQVRGTRSALAERNADGHFVDVVWDREQLARYGISITDAQSLIENAVGGSDIGTVVSGRERYPVNVRYNREFRSDLDSMSRLTVAASGSQVPLSNLAQIRVQGGPSMIRDENGLPTSYVFLDTAGRDPESYINEADHLLREKLHLPAGYTFEWSGQYPLMQQVMARLRVVVPVTVCLVALLLYINTRSMIKTIIVLLAMPFSAVGAIWFLYFAGYNLSAAVWVGLIALLGIDAETGVFMLLYLDLAYHDASRRGKLRDFGHLREAVMQGAAKRLRPKLMTFACTCIGLLPLLWATGAGADLMKRIAAPMVGGIVTSFVLELFIYPVIYELWRGRNLRQPAGIALDLMEPAHAAISGD